MEGRSERSRGRASRPPFWLGVAALLAILAFFLWQEHRAHAFDAAIVLALLACPLLHLFMHRGHGNQGRSESVGGAPHARGSTPGDLP